MEFTKEAVFLFIVAMEIADEKELFSWWDILEQVFQKENGFVVLFVWVGPFSVQIKPLEIGSLVSEKNPIGI